jgi:hypothetical protein
VGHSKVKSFSEVTQLGRGRPTTGIQAVWLLNLSSGCGKELFAFRRLSRKLVDTGGGRGRGGGEEEKDGGMA